MKELIKILLVALLALLASCSSLMDGKYVHKDGKESPYKATHDPYEPPKDPTSRF
jgi:PBP1b-binding outer membrane lipoprotein LpoB